MGSLAARLAMQLVTAITVTTSWTTPFRPPAGGLSFVESSAAL